MAIITHHARIRAKQRLGFCKNAIEKSATTALEKGFDREDVKGSLRQFLDDQWRMHDSGLRLIVWAEHVYIFQEDVLVTVYCLPTRLKRFANRIARRRK